MSEYIFPTVFSYTDGSGSGSGPDPDDQVPCSNCGFSAGTNIDTHYIATGALVSKDAVGEATCCPVLPREGESPISRVFVPENQTIAMQVPPGGNIFKDGPGTMVIIPPPQPQPLDPGWTHPNPCGTLTVKQGTVVIADPGAFTRGGDCDITFTPDFDLDYGNQGPVIEMPKSSFSNPLYFNSIDFGQDELFSYTSNPIYRGRIDLGFGKIELAQDGMSPIDLKAMLIAGRNGGSWDGPVGFTTSESINGIKNIGYANILADGVTTIGWAAPGDTNLDGYVDILDIANIISSTKYDSGIAADWSEGDFNYDGVVDVLDVSTLLSDGLYNTDNYFPQDTSFTIFWKPQIKECPGGNSYLQVSTNIRQAPKSKIIRATTPPFVSPTTGKEVVLGCEILTKLQCNNKASSVFVAGGNCNDNSCIGHDLPSVRKGACCVPDAVAAANPYNFEEYSTTCGMVNDTEQSTAESYCIDFVKGVWQGYGSVCVDQTCIGSTTTVSNTKIITIPTGEAPSTNGLSWGGCCVPDPRVNQMTIVGFLPPKCMTFTHHSSQFEYSYKDTLAPGFQPAKTALQKCDAVGGVFAGYGKDCPFCF